MISLIVLFIASLFVSFIGSLQLGPVNLFVINAALYQSKKNAYLVAIGGCIPEFIYCALAVFANHYLLKYDWFIFLFKVAFIVILICIGFAFYFKMQSTISITNELDINKQPIKYVLKGFSLAVLNPQLLPFWMFIQVYFNSISFLHIQSNYQKVSYILGSGVGAFILLVVFIRMVIKYKELILKYINNKYYFKTLSLLFFLIAMHQFWLLIN